jgi:hypothetical protein
MGAQFVGYVALINLQVLGGNASHKLALFQLAARFVDPCRLVRQGKEFSG